MPSTQAALNEHADVVVVGSGAAGMTAAIVAHDQGAKVVITERTDKIGGTSAVSGGGIWIPLNHRMKAAGFDDSRSEALEYCKALSMGVVDDVVLEAFVDNAADMVRYIEQHTPLTFTAMTAPDYHPEVDGGKQGGRSIEPDPFDTTLLGDWKERLRPPNAFAFPITRQEAFGKFDAFYRPWLIPQDLAVERMMAGVVALGQALCAGLLKAVLDRNIKILLNTRVSELIVEEGQVIGARANGEHGMLYLNANAGVILASGGFEWNKKIMGKFVPGAIENPNSPPFNEGDGLLMAMEVGADLANMCEVWNYPSLMIPGEAYEGRPLSRAINPERNGPHVIWVNRYGKRFVNEVANYNSIGRSFQQINTSKPVFDNLPAWAIMDAQYRASYPVGTAMPDDPDPQWVIRADSIEELAEKIDVDAATLKSTIERWNQYCRNGKDDDFHRGESSFDRFQGDKQAAHPNLGTIEKAPFYSFPIHTGALGTKGGPRTNQHAQVLNVRGNPIGGLYAVGNVASSITGPGYFGRGSTLGPGMTWGYLAGRHITAQDQSS